MPAGAPDPANDHSEPALIRVLATLLDSEVGVADPAGLIAADDWLRLEARHMEPQRAHFVLARG